MSTLIIKKQNGEVLHLAVQASDAASLAKKSALVWPGCQVELK